MLNAFFLQREESLRKSVFRPGRLSRERKRIIKARAMWYATSFAAHHKFCCGSEKELCVEGKTNYTFGLDLISVVSLSKPVSLFWTLIYLFYVLSLTW